jgi:flagellar biogenesis protein FliO
MAAEVWHSSSRFRAWVVAVFERLRRLSRRPEKCLRLCETLTLGERRFVAVVEFERTRFLVGGTPSSLVLLSRLPNSGEPADVNTADDHASDRDRDRDRDRDDDENSGHDTPWIRATLPKKRVGEKC